MDKKLNPLDGEIDLLGDNVSDIIRKLNPLTGRLELVYSASSYIQKVNPFIGDFDMVGGTGASYIIKEVTGNGYINLTNAIANHLMELKAYGGTEQNGTPTPTTPVDIVCNNGALKIKDSELPVGYKRVLGYTCNNNVLWQITGFKLRGSDTVRISFSVLGACNVFGCYQGADANDNYDLYVSTTSGSKYLRYGSGTYLSYWSNANLGERFDVVFSPTGTSGMPQDSTWSPLTFESANNLLICATTLTGTSSKLKGDLYGNIIVDNRLNLIPCERVSDNSLGYYDTYSDTFFEPTGTPTSLGYDYTYTPEIVVEGTTETVEDELSNSATAENLLAIGDIKDVQEILHGHITRKIGVWICDGTEERKKSTSDTIFYIADPIMYKTNSRVNGISTHYVGTDAVNSSMPNYSIKIGPTTDSAWANYGCVFIRDNRFSTKEDWCDYLAQQYQAGTPVLFLYILATPTTETVTGQTLNIQDGNNAIEITQASIDDLGLYAKYKATE